MRLIKNNPYRIAGLLANTSAREKDRQIKRLIQCIEAEQEPQDYFSFPIFGVLNRTIDNIEEAKSNLNLDSDKIIAALFWFWNGNPITDEAAFEALKCGEIETASQIWSKLVTKTDENGNKFWNTVTENNFSAFHNYSVLSIVKANGNLSNAVVANLLFLESDLVQKFVYSVADETLKISKKELQLLFLNHLHADIEKKQKTSLPNFLEIINKCEFTAKRDFMKGFVQKPLESAEQKIEISKSKRKANKSNAEKTGQELFLATESLLNQIKIIVGSGDLIYTSAADKVSNEILQCSIDYFNESSENNSSTDYFNIAMKLAKQAETLAVSKLMKDRIKDNIETLEEQKDREISQAILILNSVKDAYDNIYKEILKKAKQQIGIHDDDNNTEKDGKEKRHIVYLKPNPFESRTINYTAIEEYSKKSINWENVNELLTSILSSDNLKKIKKRNNSEAKNELWELLNWIKKFSLEPSITSSIIAEYKSIPPILYFEILSSEVKNKDNNPFYVEDIRYVSLNLKIKATEVQKITFYLKYINPEGNFKYNSKSSPEGYTTSDVITIKPETKEINLGGWGSANECTYMVGEHKIEVYVDQYKIYTKAFNVDWSPVKKLELTRNIELLQNELNVVQEFQWFRSSETKQKEVKEVQNKIIKAKQILINK